MNFRVWLCEGVSFLHQNLPILLCLLVTIYFGELKCVLRSLGVLSCVMFLYPC